MSGIHGNPRRLWKPPGRSPYVRLRHMDFLRYSGGGCEMRTKPPSIRHPGSFRAFRDIRVPEFLDTGRNIRKSHMPAQDSFGGLPGRRLIHVLWLPFIPAVGTAVHGSPKAHKTCQKGKSPLSCSDVGGAASGAFHSVGCLCATGFLLLYLDSELGHFGFVLNDIIFVKIAHCLKKPFIL